MKAIQASEYGSASNLCLNEDIPKPIDIPKNRVLIRTEAVALAPGDVRTLSGRTKELQGPSSFPYIPGGDACGIIVDMGSCQPDDLGFDLGDRITARFDGYPLGALGEFALVSIAMCGKVPDEVSAVDAVALASSATIALSLSKRIRKGERVLVLGAGGGVGSHLCQLLRLRYIDVSGVSSNKDRLLKAPIYCNEALDYTEQDPLTYQAWKDKPFDVIVDLASGSWTPLLNLQSKGEPLIIKPASEGGRFLTTSLDEFWYDVNGILPALKKFLLIPLWRASYSRLSPASRKTLPAFTFATSLVNDLNIMNETLQLAKEGQLKASVDKRGPFSFTTTGVREAFRLQESRHVKGKAVIDFKL